MAKTTFVTHDQTAGTRTTHEIHTTTTSSEPRGAGPSLNILIGAFVVAVAAGMFFAPDTTKIVLMTLAQTAWIGLNWLIRVPGRFLSWGAEQVNLGLTLKEATPCATHMCAVDVDKFSGLLMQVVERQTAAYDCAPILLTAANTNFLTRHMGYLTNSPDATQKKCYTTYDLNGAERTTCTSSDELPPCAGAMSWPTVEEDMRAILTKTKGQNAQCQKAIGDQGSAAVAVASPLCANSLGATGVEIKEGVSENWNGAMKKLIKEWFKDIAWHDVMAAPQSYCRDLSVLNLQKVIVKVQEQYCPSFTKRVEGSLNKLINVIIRNKGKHPKSLQLPAPGADIEPSADQ